MVKIKITDTERQSGGIDYTAKSIAPLVGDLGGEMQTFKGFGRAELTVSCPERYQDLFRSEIESKVAEVLAISHKNAFLRRKIHPAGLSGYQMEILYTAVISADIEDDKRYILRRLRGLENYHLDGVYNFKLRPLKNKWKEIAGYIPMVFSHKQLVDFVAFVAGEKRGKRVIVKDGKVFDGNYNLLQKSVLLGERVDIIKEILLSASGSVQVSGKISQEQEKYLKGFFGKRVNFNCF